jgi:outer membrane lipoprotein-sorting protein
LFYITNDYQTSYLGMGKAGEEDAYKIKITKPSGKVSVEFYSVKSKLLLHEESTSTESGNETTVMTDYSNYKKVGNVTLPYTITQTVGEQEFAMSISDIKINEGVTDADFKQD